MAVATGRWRRWPQAIHAQPRARSGDDHGPHRRRERPGQRVALGAPGEQLAATPPDDEGDEDDEPGLAEHRPAHGLAEVDRGEEHVANVGGLERDRPAPASRPQPESGGERGEDAQTAGEVDDEAVDLRPGQLVAAGDAGQHQHRDARR